MSQSTLLDAATLILDMLSKTSSLRLSLNKLLDLSLSFDSATFYLLMDTFTWVARLAY